MKVLISDNLHQAGIDILKSHPNIVTKFLAINTCNFIRYLYKWNFILVTIYSFINSI